RAMLKVADVCALEPERTARRIVDRGVALHYDAVLQGLKEIPYGQWRQYDPEDAMRFFALRLQEAGVIQASAQKPIAEGTDWRFLHALKKEGSVGVAEDRSCLSIAHRQVGPITVDLAQLPKEEEVFGERTSVLLKQTRVVRLVDRARRTLVYL